MHFRKYSSKTPETLSERVLEFPSRARPGSPKPYNSGQSRLPARSQNSLPPSTAGNAPFFVKKWFRRGPLIAGHGIPSSAGGISDCLHACWLVRDTEILTVNERLFNCVVLLSTSGGLYPRKWELECASSHLLC